MVLCALAGRLATERSAPHNIIYYFKRLTHKEKNLYILQIVSSNFYLCQDLFPFQFLLLNVNKSI
jgi:hypothetical protein